LFAEVQTVAPFHFGRTRARALLALLAISLLMAALAPGLAGAKEHSDQGGKKAAAQVPAAPVVTAPAAPARAAQPGNGTQAKPGKDKPGKGNLHSNGGGDSNGNRNGHGQRTPGHDRGASGNGNGSNEDSGMDTKPGKSGKREGSKPGKDDRTSTTARGRSVRSAAARGRSVRSAPAADSGDRAVATQPLPVTVPDASAPVAAPQRERSTGSRRSRNRKGGRSTDRQGSGRSRRVSARGTGSGSVARATGSGATRTTSSAGAATGAAAANQSSKRTPKRSDKDEGSPVTRTVTRTVRDIVKVMPDSAKLALAALAALAVLLGAGYLFTALRARRLARQRRELLQEVGLLQGALLPEVPAAIGSLRTSVAYRPADGPAAGGDFYDVLPLAGDRVGFILGDISGHGHEALQRTAFMRYTLRAYLEAGLEPRVALQVAGRVIDDNFGGDFATVLVAVHDPKSGTFTYASAGHPGPIVIGNGREHEPVSVASSPPIGIGVRTGLRQTTLPLTHGSIACLFTDGLTEARTEDGILGRWRLQKLLKELGPNADAGQLLEKVAAEARVTSDDMATCLIAPGEGATAGGFRTEQLELTARELDGPLAESFLAACAIPDHEASRALHDAKAVAGQFDGVVLHVVLGNRRSVEVLPRNVESIEAASRRRAAVGH